MLNYNHKSYEDRDNNSTNNKIPNKDNYFSDDEFLKN